LGFAAIFLSIISIKFRLRFTWFWVFIGTFFAILSLGPELRVYNNLTGIWMPERILFDFIPGWEELRSSGRFIIMTHLAMAILSAFTVDGIMKSKMFSKKILTSIVIGIFAIVIFDVSASPYPSFTEEIPDFYKEIKNDKADFNILEMPIGSEHTNSQNSIPKIAYYQTFHEKPIFGGHESRPTLNELEQTDTYFLKNFQRFENDSDIIKQDLSEYGISIMNYFNIKYAILHKDQPVSKLDSTTEHISIGEEWIKNKESIMSKILNTDKVYFEDSRISVWKIPQSTETKPFIILGEGWRWFDHEIQGRPMLSESYIEILNPEKSKIKFSILLELIAYKQNRNVEIYFNGEKLNGYEIDSTSKTNIELNNLLLIPGKNVVTIKSDGSDKRADGFLPVEFDISLFGIKISEKET